MRFRNREEAGRALTSKLHRYAGRQDTLVLALPRGGVPVAFQVARALDVPLDVVLVRKLGVPGREELAMGAIAAGGTTVLNQEPIARFGVTRPELMEVVGREQQELERQERLYRAGPPPEVDGKTVILVDDGLATGSTMRVAARALRRAGADRIVVAVPVAAPEACDTLHTEADSIVCAHTPEGFVAVGEYYDDFSPTTDEEVRDLLSAARLCVA
jgi:putative phosphoribosyl transferase